MKVDMASMIKSVLLVLFLGAIAFTIDARTFYVGENNQYIYNTSSFSVAPVGGDTIKILAERHTRLQFRALEGTAQAPIVFINSGGVVKIKGWSMPAIMFENCKYVKISGKGDVNNRFGFYLSGPSFGLSFEQYCSYCEAEYLHIDSCSLGVHAKKDFGGYPPVPYPVFTQLAVHDNFIDHCTESMYIGETKSPGMEFRHVRIYNNVITNSGRESFQIANCVEDMEAYNNFCLNSGLEGSAGQMNNSQFGGNSIGKFYNNIFIKAPADGVAVFGMGDMSINDNYFEQNQGIFADDRYTPIVGAPFRIEDNYFHTTLGNTVITLKNSYFDLFVNNNSYDTPGAFLSASASLLKQSVNNRLTTVFPLNYNVVNGVYEPDSSNPYYYTSMGPQVGLGHTYNATPVIRNIPDIIINTDEYQEFILIATTDDNDIVTFSAKGLPAFVTLVQGPSGSAMLKVDGRNQSKGVYFITIMAIDQSHGAVARQTLKIALKSPDNHPVTLPPLMPVSMESASKLSVNISGTDLDGDSIRYTVSLPSFVDFAQTKSSAVLNIKPTYLITGDYAVIIKAEDGYSAAVTDTLNIHVSPATLTVGKIIYRVNYGGNELEDSPINWQKDNGNNSSYESNYSAGTGSASWSGTNNTGAPNNLFGPYRYNGVGMEDMLFEYPCVNARYMVNLYFAERNVEVTNNLIEVFS
ncbi:MAG: malectin domain-containing carbohydrate-binding protein, partial [Bacteroidales bacterium]